MTNRSSSLAPRFLLVSALLLAGTAHATTCKNGGTDWPTCTTPHPVTPSVPSTSTNTQTSSSAANASAQAGASASVSGSLSAAGGAGGSMSYEEFSRSSMYVLPAPVHAAPLPPGLCPQGDSVSWSFGWNLISYAKSQTRTELDCLDRVLNAWREAPRVQVVQQPYIPPAVEPAKASAKPKPAAKRVVASKAQPECVEDRIPSCKAKR